MPHSGVPHTTALPSMPAVGMANTSITTAPMTTSTVQTVHQLPTQLLSQGLRHATTTLGGHPVVTRSVSLGGGHMPQMQRRAVFRHSNPLGAPPPGTRVLTAPSMGNTVVPGRQLAPTTVTHTFGGPSGGVSTTSTTTNSQGFTTSRPSIHAHQYTQVSQSVPRRVGMMTTGVGAGTGAVAGRRRKSRPSLPTLQEDVSEHLGGELAVIAEGSEREEHGISGSPSSASSASLQPVLRMHTAPHLANPHANLHIRIFDDDDVASEATRFSGNPYQPSDNGLSPQPRLTRARSQLGSQQHLPTPSVQSLTAGGKYDDVMSSYQGSVLAEATSPLAGAVPMTVITPMSLQRSVTEPIFETTNTTILPGGNLNQTFNNNLNMTHIPQSEAPQSSNLTVTNVNNQTNVLRTPELGIRETLLDQQEKPAEECKNDEKTTLGLTRDDDDEVDRLFNTKAADVLKSLRSCVQKPGSLADQIDPLEITRQQNHRKRLSSHKLKHLLRPDGTRRSDSKAESGEESGRADSFRNFGIASAVACKPIDNSRAAAEARRSRSCGGHRPSNISQEGSLGGECDALTSPSPDYYLPPTNRELMGKGAVLSQLASIETTPLTMKDFKTLGKSRDERSAHAHSSTKNSNKNAGSGHSGRKERYEGRARPGASSGSGSGQRVTRELSWREKFEQFNNRHNKHQEPLAPTVNPSWQRKMAHYEFSTKKAGKSSKVLAQTEDDVIRAPASGPNRMPAADHGTSQVATLKAAAENRIEEVENDRLTRRKSGAPDLGADFARAYGQNMAYKFNSATMETTKESALERRPDPVR